MCASVASTVVRTKRRIASDWCRKVVVLCNKRCCLWTRDVVRWRCSTQCSVQATGLVTASTCCVVQVALYRAPYGHSCTVTQQVPLIHYHTVCDADCSPLDQSLHYLLQNLHFPVVSRPAVCHLSTPCYFSTST